MTTITTSAHHHWLHQHFCDLLAFWSDGVADDGMANWLDDSGRPMARMPRQTYTTARLAHCFSLGALAGVPGCRTRAAKAVRGLAEIARDHEHGGWLAGFDVAGHPDATKTGYTHAFVVLGASSALIAGIKGADTLFQDASSTLLDRFWDDEAGLLRDGFSADWADLDSYRGMNANMHGVEAMLAAYDATGDVAWLERTQRVATFFAVQARATNWRIPEHYDEHWIPDLDFNIERPDDQFKPYGATVGHALEWARLMLNVAAASGRDAELEDAANNLFHQAVADGWSVDGQPGFVYTTDWDGQPVTDDRLHWVLTEAIGAAATLYQATGDERVAALYEEWWEYADTFMLDHERGSWRHQLDANNQPATTIWPGKNDLYHALQATLAARVPLTPAFALALKKDLVEW